MKQKTATWIRRTHLFRRDEYECSACGARTDRPYRTCPRCGAPMKGCRSDASWVDEKEAVDALSDD